MLHESYGYNITRPNSYLNAFLSNCILSIVLFVDQSYSPCPSCFSFSLHCSSLALLPFLITLVVILKYLEKLTEEIK